jgi:4-aminobutyrate aminotransferase
MNESTRYNDLLKRAPDLLAPSLAEDWPKIPVVRAEEPYLYTANHQRILDFTAGIAVTNIGHGHPKVLQAAIRQMQKFSHSAVGITLHEPLLELAATLPQVLPEGMDMFFFGNSGSEAVEGAIKLARYVTGRPAIISFMGGFHGRTFGSASVTSVKSKYRNQYEPLLGGMYFAEYPYPYRCPMGNDPQAVIDWAIGSIQNLFDRLVPPSQVAAFLIEPVQGEGGYIIPPVGFFPALRELCDQYGILLILDEIQTGFGRTGEMFAAQALSARPDIMAIAKGIANGFPMSATVSSRELMSRWSAGSHGTTYGGNPVACAAALATLEVIREENLLENCRKMGNRLLSGFQKLQEEYPVIGETRGLGLMVAMELVVPGSKEPNPQTSQLILDQMLEQGLLAYMAGNKGQVIRCMPPLTITEEQVDEALAIVGESFRRVCA